LESVAVSIQSALAGYLLCAAQFLFSGNFHFLVGRGILAWYHLLLDGFVPR